ncbi:EpsG family protein [Planococcus liqunii]|uniref:EpsG family protein n=1 Tax=Planococcus liqunii TaxID=3058394 RepID=UPI002622BB41|nr:EpsG family protein [Planococcus sp. N056]WKA50213.1 EpsG family protein [Planococcus sp. N056]
MIAYLLLILLWIYFYFILRVVKSNDPHKRFYEALLYGFSLFLLMGLRHSTVGSDIMQYLSTYNNSSFYSYYELLKNSEWGFEAFNIILKNFYINEQGYLLITSFLIVLAFSVFYFKYSKYIFLSFFLHLTIGLFTMSMSGIRQTLAVGIILFAFQYIIKKKFFIFSFLILLAFTFHNSAIVFFPVYFLRNIVINRKNGSVILGIVISTLLFRENLTPLIEFFMPERYTARYDVLSEAYPVNPMIVLIAILIPLVCLILWENVKNLKEKERKIYSLLFLLSCLNAFTVILSLNSNIIGRLSFYFVTFNILLIPNMIKIIKDKNFKFIGVLACIILPLIQFLLSTPDGTLQIDNYKFYWD